MDEKHILFLEKEIKMDSENFVPHGDYWFDIIREVRLRTL